MRLLFFPDLGAVFDSHEKLQPQVSTFGKSAKVFKLFLFHLEVARHDVN